MIAPLGTLTKREVALLGFVHSFTATRGYGPSFREIGAAIGGRSTGSLTRLLDGLMWRGFLARRRGRARSIETLVLPPPVSRSPDGKPLYFIPIGGSQRGLPIAR